MKNKMLKKYQEILTRTAATVLLFVLVFQPFLVLADEVVSGTSSVQESSTSTEQVTGVGSDGDSVQNVNQPPVIQSVSWDQSATAGVPLTFTVNANDDQTSSADLWYSVDWNDGSNTALSKGQNVLSHTFAAAGTYNVVFTVAESDQPNAGLHSYSVTVSVANTSSTGSSTSTDTSSSSEQESSSTTASTSSTSTASTTNGTEQTGIPHISSIAGSTTVYVGENNLFTIYATDKDGHISSNLVYKVDWGDGASTTFQDHPTFAHVYSSAGVYNITFTVMDRNDSGVDSYTQRIEVVGNDLNLQNSETAAKLDNKSSDSARTSTIHVTSPNGGEFYSVGTTMHITWEDASSSPNSRYNIFLIKDGKQHLIDYGVATGTQYYYWKIPTSFVDRWNSGNEVVDIAPGSAKIYHIRVCPIDSDLCDASDASFTITNEAPSWYGLYYDYSANDPGMNLSSNQWPDNIDIGPQDPKWNSSKYGYWYDDAHFVRDGYDDLNHPINYFPLDDLGADDPTRATNHNFHFGAHFMAVAATVAQEGDYTYILRSDDDTFLYVDGVLKENNSGLIPAHPTRTGSIHMVPGRYYRLDIYFAERHAGQSALEFRFTTPGVVINPCRDGKCPPSTRTIHVTSPNGGEFYSVGTTMHITWEDASSSPNSRYNIFLIKDGKQHLVDYGVATGTQHYDWKIPSSFIDRWDNRNELVNIVSGKIYHIRVCPIDSILCDASDASFTITNEAASESPSWCGLYYDYRANDTGMNLPGNQWPDKIDIGPQDPNWNSSRFSYWYSNDRFATSSYKTTLTDGSFFPLDYLGADDPSGSSTHNFHFGAHFISYASVEQEGDYRYTLLSDDDSFLYVDNVLKENRSGLINGPESMRRGTLHMVPGHLYRIDIYFAERHQPGSAIYFYFNKTDQNGNDINEGDPRVTLIAPNTCARPGSANPAILPESLPNGVVGTNYGTTTFTPTGFLAPASSLVWTVSEGSLPPGLTLTGDKIGGIPTTVGTYTFTIMASTTGEFATRTYTINVTSNTNNNPGSGSNPGSGGGEERRGGGYIPLVPTVLGTSTVATGTCEVYLHKYIKYGAKNDPAEVRKLQAFLRVFEKRSDIAVTGVYDYKTYMAVKDFQKKYMKGVLAPWGISEPTGYVFITTTLKINMLYCGFSTDVKLNLRNFYKNKTNTDSADSNYEASNAVQSTSASLTFPIVATTSATTTEVATVTRDLTRNLTAGGFDGLSTCSALSWFPWLIVVLLVIYIIWDHGRREDEKSVEKVEKK